jgi:hypothetical protein
VAVPGATLPEIDKETCVKMITTMVSVNEFDKVYNDAQRQGRLSFYFTNRGMPRRARTPDWQTPGRPATHTLEPRRGQVRRRWRWARRRRSSSPTGSGRSTASWARASGAASRTRTRPTSAVAAQRRRERQQLRPRPPHRALLKYRLRTLLPVIFPPTRLKVLHPLA